MEEKEIRDKVIDIIIDKLNVNVDEITDNASFINDLGADSLDLVDIIMDVEKTFNIVLPDLPTSKFDTLKDLVDFIQEIL